jgi:tRNA(Ile)-lysidine synthase TilS/MesJ
LQKIEVVLQELLNLLGLVNILNLLIYIGDLKMLEKDKDLVFKIKEKVKNVIIENNLIETNDKLVLAVSGGPDSMALLSQFHNDIVGVCHVNYHYRDTSDYDQSIVEKYCKIYGIKLYVLNIDSSVYTTGEVKNFEN